MDRAVCLTKAWVAGEAQGGFLNHMLQPQKLPSAPLLTTQIGRMTLFLWEEMNAGPVGNEH